MISKDNIHDIFLNELKKKAWEKLKLDQNDDWGIQKGIAKLIGVTPQTVQSWFDEDKNTFPNPLSFIRIHQFLDITPNELLGINREEHFQVVESAASYDLGNEFITVPQVTGKISAGGGLVPDNTVEMRIAFRKDWIQGKGEPKNMSLIRVRGDSMEPTLRSGDIVLVDHSRNYVDPHGGIYAVALQEDIMLKRLQAIYPSNRIRIISDNSKYDPTEVDPDNLKINGKVIWFGRELER
jgi:phage repressor protein C with HTH and peptisase S24 domain